MKHALVLLALFLLHGCLALAQGGGGYYISRYVTLPDASLTTETMPLPISSNKEDVKAIGMGKTQIANGLTFNAMLYNPALLSEARTSIDLPTLQASLPGRSFTAINYLSNHIDEFKYGTSIKEIRQGIDDFEHAQTGDEQLAALRTIQHGLQFPSDLQDKVGSSADDPKTQGISIIPGVQVQVGRFGLSVYGIGQSGFEVQNSPAISQLARYKLPATLEEVTPAQIFELLSIVEPLFDQNGNLREDALPTAYAVSYIDVVGAAGYALPITKELSIGANAKVINRRFTSKRVAADYFDNLLNEVRKDFNTSITGFTMDVGALFEFPATGTRVGMSVQNIIPIQTVTSTASIAMTNTGYQYDHDAFGNYIVTNGDTGLVELDQQVNVSIPFELKEPILLNIGGLQRLTPHWDVALDWVDVASQDDKHRSYLSRFRLGTEYRIETGKDQFGLALRAGLSDKHGTAGLGLNFFRVFQIDGAYAYDAFVDDYSYFAQLKIGW